MEIWVIQIRWWIRTGINKIFFSSLQALNVAISMSKFPYVNSSISMSQQSLHQNKACKIQTTSNMSQYSGVSTELWLKRLSETSLLLNCKHLILNQAIHQTSCRHFLLNELGFKMCSGICPTAVWRGLDLWPSRENGSTRLSCQTGF